jgi:CelD/BcsL family acetyltransferase involved in cellulose biosynthesis
MEYDIAQAPAPGALARLWIDATAAGSTPFFLGWTWMSAWLAATGAAPLLLRGRRDDGAGGIGLLSPARGRDGARVFALNEAGDPARDTPFIERNGLAGLDPSDLPAVAALARFFVGARRSGELAGWDEIRLSGVPRGWMDCFAAAGLHVELRAASTTQAVDLAALRGQGDPLAAMRPNTRQQIRRARRLYAALGDVVLERVDGDAALDELVSLHQARWTAKGAAGAFASPVFAAFVRELLARGGPIGAVELLRARAGRHSFAMLLNLVAGGVVSNYVSGVAPVADNRFKPGLLAHALAIERALAAGHRSYDLLAGASRYKQSLAEPGDRFVWLSLRPRGVIPTLRVLGVRCTQLLGRARQALRGGAALRRGARLAQDGAMPR